MAARATRSSSRKVRLTDAVATGPFGALSHDELGVIVDGLADPLQPVVAVALSSTCLGLRTPLQAALQVLRQRHERAAALCRKLSCNSTTHLGATLVANLAELRGAERLEGSGLLDDDDMATLGMILRTNGLPCLQVLYPNSRSGLGDASMRALCGGLGRGAAPSLRVLGLAGCNFGPAGAEALAAALRRGAFPKIEMLSLGHNPIGSQGVAALAAPLRKMPALSQLLLDRCEIVDEGVASLVDNLGKDDFKALEYLDLSPNDHMTDKSCACLITALDCDALPRLCQIYVSAIETSEAAVRWVHDALARAVARRAL